MTRAPEVDHVVLGVADLDDAAARLAEQGITALPGGTHPHWGTANRIVPLGSAYLELVAVVDADVAATSAFGSWVAAQARGDAAWGWAVRSQDIAATAERLGLDLVAGSRVRPDGVTLSWQLAGVPDEGSDRSLPFFIAWGDGVPMPGGSAVTHDAGTVLLRGLTVGGDDDALRGWLDGEVDGVVVTPGRPGVLAVVLTTPSAEITLRPPLVDPRP
ncbi:VOC family protein [Longivirga aurantiaca]|uniref:VOC family protein n=1 Tax=Longivirga aurantiaca TaxID=1837743 RepID=A0ABW1T2T7_9ACTN